MKGWDNRVFSVERIRSLELGSITFRLALRGRLFLGCHFRHNLGTATNEWNLPICICHVLLDSVDDLVPEVTVVLLECGHVAVGLDSVTVGIMGKIREVNCIFKNKQEVFLLAGVLAMSLAIASILIIACRRCLKSFQCSLARLTITSFMELFRISLHHVECRHGNKQ
jgi:hypothetical protein